MSDYSNASVPDLEDIINRPEDDYEAKKAAIGKQCSEDTSLEQSSPLELDIYPRGDVILVLSNTHLRVSSVILKASSKVFAAMFGPHFSEGQNLDENKPKEIEFPDDDPEGMKVLCAVLHHNFNTTRTPKLKTLKEIAVLVDKYDCFTAMFTTVTYWIANIRKKANSAALMDLSGIAYLFDHAQAFYGITQDLVIHHSGPFSMLEGTVNVMPPRFPLLLAEARDATRNNLVSNSNRIIMDHVLEMTKASRYCSMRYINSDVEYNENVCGAVGCNELSEMVNGHEKHNNLDDFLRKLEALKFSHHHYFADICTECSRIGTKNLLVALEAEAAYIRSHAEGVCLDCLKNQEEKNGEQRPPCRVSHKLRTNLRKLS